MDAIQTLTRRGVIEGADIDGDALGTADRLIERGSKVPNVDGAVARRRGEDGGVDRTPGGGMQSSQNPLFVRDVNRGGKWTASAPSSGKRSGKNEGRHLQNKQVQRHVPLCIAHAIVRVAQEARQGPVAVGGGPELRRPIDAGGHHESRESPRETPGRGRRRYRSHAAWRAERGNDVPSGDAGDHAVVPRRLRRPLRGRGSPDLRGGADARFQPRRRRAPRMQDPNYPLARAGAVPAGAGEDGVQAPPLVAAQQALGDAVQQVEAAEVRVDDDALDGLAQVRRRPVVHRAVRRRGDEHGRGDGSPPPPTSFPTTEDPHPN